MGAPNTSNFNNITDAYPITTLASASYQINSGTAIAADAVVADTVTATGVKTTDTRLAICPRDAVVIPNGLQLKSLVCAANDAVIITWVNRSGASITPPSAGVWSLAILGNFLRS
jgi:hypothetical protein